MANNNINLKVDVDYTELTGLIKTTDQTKRALSLVSKEFANTKDQSAWMRGVMQIVRAQKKLDSSARMTQSEIMKLAHQMKQATDFSNALERATGRLNTATKRGAAVSAEFAGASGEMGRRLSRNGVMVQQAGYQLGDFIVQVQSGQNAFVAFGQQATQMAGTLTLLGGKWLAIGTALGVAIPLITVAGAAFMRARGSAKDAEEEVRTFEQRLSSSQSAIVAARDSIVDLSEEGLEVLRDRFGEVTEQVTTLENRLRNIALQNMVTEVQGAMDELFSDRFFDEIEGGFGNISASILATTPEEVKELEREISSLQAILDSTAFPSPTLKGQLQEMKDELAAMNLDFQNMGALASELKVPTETLEIYKSLEEAVKTATSEGNFIEAADGISEMLSLFEEVGAEIDKGALANMVRLEERLREGANALQQSSSIASDFSANLEKAARASGKIANKTSDIEVEIAKAEAQIEALKAGKDSEVAGFIAGEKAKVTALYESAKAMAAQTGNIVLMAEATLNFLDAMDALSRLEKLREEVNKIKGSGTSSASAPQQDPLAKFKEQLELERELVGVSEDRARVIRALGVEFVQKNPEIAEGLQEQIAKTKELNEIEKERQSILQTVETSLENGLMAMVEGTKSVKGAFKDMARAIIKELYDVYVVQRLVGGFGQNVGSGSGLIGLLGGLFGKASGGTVMSNQPYLVGEKGPEIIVPRNRGHVMNADLTADALGGGNGVTVVQNFYFQANGDDSVKKLIAQAAPSIANMAKQSVMDSRRRGGAMKNAFG